MGQGLPQGFKSKLGAWDPSTGWVPVLHQNLYHAQNISGVNRLLISTSGDPLTLLKQLLNFYGEPYRFSYFLINATESGTPTRYELSLLNRESLVGILDSYATLLRSDARHHIWIHASGGGTLIYDEHDWIYAYGSQSEIVEHLQSLGFADGIPEIPFPHLHNEDRSLDAEQEKMLEAYDWKPLTVANLS
jgi:hypothetical protein